MSQINHTTVFGPSTLPSTASYADMQAYRRDVLKLPGPINRWLTSNRWSPWIEFQRDYMLLPDIQSSHVVCFIKFVAKKVSNQVLIRPSCDWHHWKANSLFNSPTQYMLYIKAVSPRTPYVAHSISPLAVLEVFEGSMHALNAPEWTQWNHPTLQFQQPRASFAALFAWMLQWDVNWDNVSILYLDSQHTC